MAHYSATQPTTTLQRAYEAGNAIVVTTAEGSPSISNAADVTDLLTLSRSFAGAGDGIDITMGAGTTGDAIRAAVVAGQDVLTGFDGTNTLTLRANRVQIDAGAFFGPAGTATDPTYSFGVESALGIYRFGAGQLGFTSVGLRMVMSTSNLAPGADNAFDLGSAGLRFKDVYVMQLVAGVASSPATTVDINGDLATRAVSPAALAAGATNDYAGTAGRTFARLTPDAGGTSAITGITDGQDGKHLILVNIGAANLTIQHQNAGSAVANRIICSTGADVVLAADDSMTLIYDATTARWRQITTAA